MKLSSNFYYVLDSTGVILGRFPLLSFAKMFAFAVVRSELLHNVDIYHGSKCVNTLILH